MTARSRQSATHVTLVGAGNLARALGPALKAAGYTIDAVASRAAQDSRRRALALAKKLQCRVIPLEEVPLEELSLEKTRPASQVVWLCHTDDALAETARVLARRPGWKGRIVFHSSGALTSDVLAPLRRAGAFTASLHPMMTFTGAIPPLAGVPFAVEGDRRAVPAAGQIVRALEAKIFTVQKKAKVLYHALGSFTSPLVVATLVTAERVGRAAGFSPAQLIEVMEPILRQTIQNYLEKGASAAFSGAIRRGDLATIRHHLESLQKVPGAREVYQALAASALIDMPSGNKKELLHLLETLR